MCGYTDHGETLPIDQFKQMADSIDLKVNRVMLIGGEVMLHPNFYDICEYVFRFGAKIGITTNLYSLTGRRAEAVERFLNILRVSIDGATKHTYESIRTNLSWEKLLDNLHTLAAIKSQKTKCDLYWYFVAMRRNIEELPAAVEMAHRFGFHAVTVNFVIARRPLPLDESLLFHRDLANRCFDQARNRAIELGIELKIPRNFDLSLHPHLNSRPGEVLNLCTQPWDHICVALNGDITTCCYLGEIVMGNLFDENFDHIWNGSKFQSLRKSIKTGSFEMPDRCRSCPLLCNQWDSNNAMLHCPPKRICELQDKLST